MQSIEDLENVLRNAPARDGMIAAVDDDHCFLLAALCSLLDHGL
jgi:hypothetical protein